MNDRIREFREQMEQFKKDNYGILFNATGPIPRPPNKFDVTGADIITVDGSNLVIVYRCSGIDDHDEYFVDEFQPFDPHGRAHFEWWWRNFQHDDRVPTSISDAFIRFDRDLLTRFVESVYVDENGRVIDSDTSMRNV